MKKEKKKLKRGFASLTPERLKEVASTGGKSAHEKGVAYRFTSEKAKEAVEKRWRNKLKKVK